MVSARKVSVDAVRRLQLEKQGIGEPPRKANKKRIGEMIERLRCIQIDTINVVERAHYFTLWTRLGQYKKDDLYKLAYEDRSIFEGWGHAMCYMPMNHWRYLIAANKERAHNKLIHTGWFSRVPTDILDSVLERVKNEGPLGSADFEGKKPSGGWWGWKPQKQALEALFSTGELMVTRRDGFKRIYDLTERVLPSGVDLSEPTEAERNRFFATRTLGALGATKPTDVKCYYHSWCVKFKLMTKDVQALFDDLAKEGIAEKLNVDGSNTPYYCLTEDTTRLEKLEKEWHYDVVLLINYFDSMLWHADRLKSLFGFKRALEVYLKPEQRKYGYYSVPILYGDSLVGRLDPKVDRKEKKLIIRGLWYEEGFKPDEEYENAFVKTLDDFTKFNGADKIDWRLEKKPTS